MKIDTTLEFDKVKEKWGTNFQWDADNYTLTLSPV